MTTSVSASMPRPADLPGFCNAWLQFADDYGDNDCTFACRLPTGHTGWHETLFGDYGHGKRVQWEYDQRPELEAEDAVQRGYHDSHYGEPPSEPGEHYLAGYLMAVEEQEDAVAEAEADRQAELDEIANDLDDVISPAGSGLCRICQHDAALHRHQRGACQAVVDGKPCGCTFFMYNDPRLTG